MNIAEFVLKQWENSDEPFSADQLEDAGAIFRQNTLTWKFPDCTKLYYNHEKQKYELSDIEV